MRIIGLMQLNNGIVGVERNTIFCNGIRDGLILYQRSGLMAEGRLGVHPLVGLGQYQDVSLNAIAQTLNLVKLLFVLESLHIPCGDFHAL